MQNSATQSLHLVLGGELTSLDDTQFADVNALDIIGVFADYHEALNVWKSASQRNVDNAMMRYFIVPLHHLLTPVSHHDAHDNR